MYPSHSVRHYCIGFPRELRSTGRCFQVSLWSGDGLEVLLWFFIIFFFLFLLCWVFLVVWGLLFAEVRKPLIAAMSLVAEHRLWGVGLPWLKHVGSVVVVPRLSSVGSIEVALRHVGYSWTRDWTCPLCVGKWILYHWATREALTGTSLISLYSSSRFILVT